MADSYTALLRFILQQDMGNVNQWGSIFNSAVTDLIEQSIAGKSVIDITSGDRVLSSQNGLVDESRSMFIEAIGSPGAVRTITVPRMTKLYGFGNNTNPAFGVNIKTPTSASLLVTAAQSPLFLFVDAANDVIRPLGASDAIPTSTPWASIDLYEEGQAGVVVTAEWSRQGELVSIYIPAFSHTFTSTIMAMRVGGPAGALPAQLAIGGPTLGLNDLILDDVGVTDALLPVAFTLNSANDRLEWIEAGVTSFVSAAQRSLPVARCYTYSTRPT